MSEALSLADMISNPSSVKPSLPIDPRPLHEQILDLPIGISPSEKEEIEAEGKRQYGAVAAQLESESDLFLREIERLGTFYLKAQAERDRFFAEEMKSMRQGLEEYQLNLLKTLGIKVDSEAAKSLLPSDEPEVDTDTEGNDNKPSYSNKDKTRDDDADLIGPSDNQSPDTADDSLDERLDDDADSGRKSSTDRDYRPNTPARKSADSNGLSDNLYALYIGAKEKRRRKDYEGALADLQRVEDTVADKNVSFRYVAFLYTEMGTVLACMERHDDAITACEYALKADGASPESLRVAGHNIGYCLESQDKLTDDILEKYPPIQEGESPLMVLIK